MERCSTGRPVAGTPQSPRAARSWRTRAVRGGSWDARWRSGTWRSGAASTTRPGRCSGSALARGEHSGAIDLILPALWGLAETELHSGNAAAAAERCTDAFERAVALGEKALLAPFAVTGIRAYLATGRPDAADRWAETIVAQIGGWSPNMRPAVDHVKGLAKLAAGSTGVAREMLEAAVHGWDDRGRIWEATWARLDLAGCLLRSNRVGEAAGVLAVAGEVTQRLGSPALLARTEELARAARSRGALDEPWRPLTGREFEVARLIADGLTNAEIAGELSISPKTASAHVEHILAKLAVARRAEIAAWVTTVSHEPDEPSSRLNPLPSTPDRRTPYGPGAPSGEVPTMGDNSEAIRRFREVLQSGDLGSMAALTDEFASRRLRPGMAAVGRADPPRELKEARRAVLRTDRHSPKMELGGIRESGDLVVIEGTIDYGNGVPVSYVGIGEFRDGKVRG